MTKGKKEEVKEVPVKNYLVLGTIIVLTLLASIYLFAWFRQYNNTKVLKSITGSGSATISAMTEVIATIYTCDSRSLCDNILKN